MINDSTNIIVIPDAALFELGFSVGAGAVVGGFAAVWIYSLASAGFDLIISTYQARAARRVAEQ